MADDKATAKKETRDEGTARRRKEELERQASVRKAVDKAHKEELPELGGDPWK